MLSALIPSVGSYPAMPLAEQLVHQSYVHPGPLVPRTAPLKFPTPTADRDRTVSRRSEPSSRTSSMGEQPNPWDLLQPQDEMCIRDRYIRANTLLKESDHARQEGTYFEYSNEMAAYDLMVIDDFGLMDLDIRCV